MKQLSRVLFPIFLLMAMGNGGCPPPSQPGSVPGPGSQGGLARRNLFEAVRHGDLSEVHDAFAYGGSLSAQDEKKQTALHIASAMADPAKPESIQVLADLLQRTSGSADPGALLRVVDSDGLTPFEVALRNTNNAVAAAQLYWTNLDDNAIGPMGSEILGKYAQNKETDLVKSLVKSMDEANFSPDKVPALNDDFVRETTCAPTSNEPKYAWMQIGPGSKATSFVAPKFALIPLGPAGKALARVIMEGDECPRIEFDETNCPQMVERAKKSKEFPVLSCEFDLPMGAKEASVVYRDGSNKKQKKSLPIPDFNSENIAVLGDTGCENDQGCNDVAKWPFKTISDRVALSKPNLIIHLGDFVYRKIDGSKDNWKVWEEDFFKPGHALFGAAPILFVRGNHEQCKESYQGWFRFLDPFNFNGEECDPKSKTRFGLFTDPYAVEWGDMKMLILDSSAITDDATKVKKWDVEVVEAHFDRLNDTAIIRGWDDAWLLTHRVTWGCAPVTAKGVLFCPASGAGLRSGWLAWEKERKASNEPLMIRKFLAGHVHLFAVTDFQDTDPLQIIVGNSGQELSPYSWRHNIHDGSRSVIQTITTSEFGYVTLHPDVTEKVGNTGVTWNLELLDPVGEVKKKVRIKGNRATDYR